MNMIVNKSDLVGYEAVDRTEVKKKALAKIVAAWESKQAKNAARFGGLGFLADYNSSNPVKFVILRISLRLRRWFSESMVIPQNPAKIQKSIIFIVFLMMLGDIGKFEVPRPRRIDPDRS